MDVFLEKEVRWRDELEVLRGIMLDCMLKEEYKWDAPCYTFRKVNVVAMRGFKEHFALWFFKGILLGDQYGILYRSGEETQALRQIRFTSMEELLKAEKMVREYLLEAIEVEKAGLKVKYLKDPPVDIPSEFREKLYEFPALEEAFRRLSPSRQRQYCHYFAGAKQEKTRRERIERYIPWILKGK